MVVAAHSFEFFFEHNFQKKGKNVSSGLIDIWTYFFIIVEYVHHYDFTICLTIYRMVFNDLQDDSHAFRQTPVFTCHHAFLEVGRAGSIMSIGMSSILSLSSFYWI